jgi:hypothetical protein
MAFEVEGVEKEEAPKLANGSTKVALNPYPGASFQAMRRRMQIVAE